MSRLGTHEMTYHYSPPSCITSTSDTQNTVQDEHSCPRINPKFQPKAMHGFIFWIAPGANMEGGGVANPRVRTTVALLSSPSHQLGRVLEDFTKDT